MKLYQSIVFAVFMVLKLQLADTKSAKIIGGTTAPQWKYAYMVSLQNYTEVTFLWQKYPVYQHFCAGTILPSKAKILTAGKFEPALNFSINQKKHFSFFSLKQLTALLE